MKYIIIAVLAITLFGCTKEAKEGNKSEVSKSKKAEVALQETTDLTLTLSGSTFTTTISPNAEWGGVQKFVTMSTNDGAVSVCNWNWSGVQAPPSMPCTANGPGFYRSWTSDKNYDVHLSNVIQIQ
jgi:hypothetical protein